MQESYRIFKIFQHRNITKYAVISATRAKMPSAFKTIKCHPKFNVTVEKERKGWGGVRDKYKDKETKRERTNKSTCCAYFF